MRRRLSTLLCRYEPRLLSRSTTILKPSSNTCCSIVLRTFAGGIGFAASLVGVRFRVEGVSARASAILIQDRNLWGEFGQWGARASPPTQSGCDDCKQQNCDAARASSAALVENCLVVFPYCWNFTLASLEQVELPASHTRYL